MSRAVIFVNGQIHDPELVRKLILEKDVLIAAKGGTRHALLMGLLPSVVIGDLDSLKDIERKRLEAGGCKLIQHPRDKNETDFELVLRYAVEAGFSQILIVGALGGRLDQILGNLSVLTGAEFTDLDIQMDDGVETARFIRQKADVQGEPGDTVSLIPWGGEVRGISTTGLRWPLKNETLFTDKTRGISNELLGSQGLISIQSGLLLVIRRRK